MKVAILDAAGLLLGFRDEPDGNALTEHEADGGAGDLIPGRYRWTGTTFWPIAADPVSDATDPNFETSFDAEASADDAKDWK